MQGDKLLLICLLLGVAVSSFQGLGRHLFAVVQAVAIFGFSLPVLLSERVRQVLTGNGFRLGVAILVVLTLWLTFLWPLIAAGQMATAYDRQFSSWPVQFFLIQYAPLTILPWVSKSHSRFQSLFGFALIAYWTAGAGFYPVFICLSEPFVLDTVSAMNLLWQSGAALVLRILPIYFAFVLFDGRANELGLRAHWTWESTRVLCAGLATVGAIYLLVDKGRNLLGAWRPPLGQLVAAFSAATLSTSLPEELLYRGLWFHLVRMSLVYRSQKSDLRRGSLLVLTSAAVFGLAHLMFHDMQTAIAGTLAGFLIAYAYLKTNNLVVAVLLHSFWNLLPAPQ